MFFLVRVCKKLKHRQRWNKIIPEEKKIAFRLLITKTEATTLLTGKGLRT